MNLYALLKVHPIPSIPSYILPSKAFIFSDLNMTFNFLTRTGFRKDTVGLWSDQGMEEIGGE